MDPTLTERRQQYTEYLVDLIAGPLHRRVRAWFDDIRADPRQRAQALKNFQGALADVATWSALRVDTEVARIVQGEDCAYLPNLLRALFLVEAKLFMIGESSGANVKIRVPSVERFVHQCFIEASRVFWKKIFLFNPACPKLEQQRNYTVCDAVAVKSVKDAVRKLVPFKDLICEMEGVRVEEAASEEEEGPEPEPEAAEPEAAAAEVAEDDDDEEEDDDGDEEEDDDGDEDEEEDENEGSEVDEEEDEGPHAKAEEAAPVGAVADADADVKTVSLPVGPRRKFF